jgi:glycosylphosphatidylinositol transamidase (GPIT) subunit GPI8
MISDSCAAFTIFDKTTAPRAIMIGSSASEEYSYSKGKDSRLDLPKTDR